MTLRSKCLLYLVITALLWSSSGVIIKSVDWNPMAIASFRSLIAAITICFLTRKTLDLRLPAKDQWITAVMLALISITFVIATRLTTAANAILLQYTAPVWVALAAPIILRERTSGRDWFFILIVFTGMALFFMDSLSAEGFWGIIVAIFSGVIFAGLAMSLRYTRNRNPMKSMIYGNFIVVVAGFFFWWQPPYPNASDLTLLVLAGIFQFGLSYYLYTLASAGVSSLEMVLITALEPILNPIWVYLVVGERPGDWALMGGAIVLITITIWSVLKTLSPSPAMNNTPTRK